MIARRSIRAFSLGYLAIILVAPVGLIFWRAVEHGLHPFWAAISNANAVHALKLTLEIAAISVPLNTAFGILCAIAIVRHRVPGMGFVNALVDLPLALSPVVVGLALYLLYGRDGWFGHWLLGHGVQVLFALPSMVLATTFVSLPFVVREVGCDAGRVGAHDVPADHAACHPLGGRVWRRPHHGAVTRRVRRGQHRLRRHRGADADAHAVRPGVVRELRPDGRLCCVRTLGRARDYDPSAHDGGEAWRSKLVT